jgi:ArsR family transcriptional regulator
MVATSAPAGRPLAVDLDRLTVLGQAVSDPVRAGVLELLRFGERCVCDLQSDLDVAQSRLSFHLKVLRDAGLVVDRRAGRWSYYALVPEAIEELHDLVAALRPRPGRLPVIREGCCRT